MLSPSVAPGFGEVATNELGPLGIRASPPDGHRLGGEHAVGIGDVDAAAGQEHLRRPYRCGAHHLVKRHSKTEILGHSHRNSACDP